MTKELFDNKKHTIIEELHLYTSDNKLKHLGYGEWVEECDKVVFTYRDYECMVTRVLGQEPMHKSHYYGGHLCGYVRIPQKHPLYGDEEFDGIDCHGGITYNDATKLHQEVRMLPPHWIGFDCGHSGDMVPSLELFRKRDSSFRGIQSAMTQLKAIFDFMNPVYRNMEYCINECMSIVDQLLASQKNCESMERANENKESS